MTKNVPTIRPISRYTQRRGEYAAHKQSCAAFYAASTTDYHPELRAATATVNRALRDDTIRLYQCVTFTAADTLCRTARARAEAPDVASSTRTATSANARLRIM